MTCNVFIGSLKHKNKINKFAYEFPLAAVTPDHKLSGLQQHIFSYSLEAKSLTQVPLVPARPVSAGGSREVLFPGL